MKPRDERQAKKDAIAQVLDELMGLGGQRSDKIEEMFLTAIEQVELDFEYAS